MVAIARLIEACVCLAFYMGLGIMLVGPARKWLPSGAPLLGHPQPPSTKVVVVTATHHEPCTYPRGDYLNLISMVNKQDYARLHDGYDCIAASTLAAESLQFTWNKVGWLLRTMQDRPDTEWLLWLDSDTVITDVSFTLPLELYTGRDLVIWGNETRLIQGDGQHGLNSGVMLFRNTRWSREFLEAVAGLGQISEPDLGELLKQQLRAEGYIYDPGLRDQNAIAYLLKKDWGRHRSHVQLVNTRYCLNCYWRDLLDPGDLRSDESRVQETSRASFISHFSGCQLCTQQDRDEDHSECEREFVKSNEYASSIMMKMLARRATRSVAQQAQIAALPHCQANPTARHCREALSALSEGQASQQATADVSAPLVATSRRNLHL